MEEKEVEVKEIKLSRNFLCTLLAIIALSLLILCKICINFGFLNGVFYGIMSILIYASSLAGLLLAFFSAKKPTFEFWTNLAVLFVTLLVL